MYEYNMIWSNLSQPFHSNSSHIHIPSFPSKNHILFFNLPSPLSDTSMDVGIGPFAGVWAASQNLHLKYTDSPSGSSHKLPVAPQLGVGLCGPYVIYARMVAVLIWWRSCAYSVIAIVTSYVQWSCHDQKHFPYSTLLPLALNIIQPPFLRWSPSLRRKVWYKCPI